MSTHRLLALFAAALAIAACGRSDRTTADSASGALGARADQAADIGHPLSVTPAAGGAAQVTPTDAKSVTLATEYKLTDDNFRRFIQASDSLAVLRKRDPQARALLDEQINDAGVDTRVSANNAGRKHLESNVAVNNAITASGLSVKDYFVASIAIAQAERFLDDSRAAPPTPALGANIDYLRAHRAELRAMRSRDAVTAAPTTKP
jgi:hypothetical protein